MINFNLILENFIRYLIKEPVLIPSITAFLIGITYYFGWIVNANNWQYQNSLKQGHIHRGFFFLVQFLIFPIFIIYGLILLLENFGWDISLLMGKLPIWFYLIIIILLLILLEKLDNWIKQKLFNFEDPIYHNLGVAFAKLGDIKYLFYLSNYSIFISSSKNLVIILLLLTLDFIILTKWARLSNLNQQGAMAIITLSGNKKLTVRLIEFIENGKFLKVQEKKSKKALALPTSNIQYIKLVTQQPNLKSFIEKIF